jgi:hypothetical protein
MSEGAFPEVGGDAHKEYGSVKGGLAATEKLVATGDPCVHSPAVQASAILDPRYREAAAPAAAEIS